MKFKTKLLPFARGYAESEGRSLDYRIASGMLCSARDARLSIDVNRFFPAYTPESVCGYAFGSGIYYNGGAIDELIAAHPEDAEELKTLRSIISKVSTGSLIDAARTDEERLASGMHACWGGGWGGHANPDYDMILHLGTDGLREKIEKYRAVNPGRDEFYDACRMSLDALDILGDRFSLLAAETAETLEDERREWFISISEALKTVPRRPAYDFLSACVFFWLSFCCNGVDSPGRFDQFMIDYWRATPEEEAYDILSKLWVEFHCTRTWNLCLSGSDENWNDDTNELTYAVLKLAAEKLWETPNITLRVHRNTPEKLWKAAADTLATGIGMPSIYNDEIVCPALEGLGIPPRDSHLYCMNGCNQIDIMGKSHMGLEDGEVCFLKCLEYALLDGWCSVSELQRSLRTGDAANFTSFEQVMDAYNRQIRYITDIALSMSWKSQQVYAEHAPNPFRSCVIQGCIERGIDYKNGGPLYGHGQILIEGLADTADSLAAVKKVVFEDKAFTMAELVAALRANFEGYEELHRALVACPKFGNGDEYVDSIAAEIFKSFSEYLLTRHTFRGGIYGSGLSTFNRAAAYGSCVGAMPNGRRRGDSLMADSISAVPGNDVNGPTAVVRSCISYDQTLAKSGFIMQIKLDKKLISDDTGKAALIELCKTYLFNGGQNITINVLDQEELLDAMKNPEAHRDLIVRVGGYSAHFISLSKGLQENILARTGYAL